jgi:hypothetical protein
MAHLDTDAQDMAGQMSSQPQVKSQPAEMMKLVCPACTNQFMVKLPQPLLINHQNFSMLLLTHEKSERCPQCGQTFKPLFVRTEQYNVFVWNFTGVPDDANEIIVVPEGTKPV